MKKVRRAIAKSTEFNKKCMAEIFGLMQDGRTEYVRGTVCVEVHKRKGKEFYTIWRLDRNGDYYEIELAETSDKEAVANHLYNIVEYEALGWESPFEVAREAILLLA
jgi:phage terminase Nu1 subunit (DNA packaging protein)